MRNIINIAVYDEEEEYINRFNIYLKEKSNASIKIVLFENKNTFLEYYGSNCLDIVLIDENSYERNPEIFKNITEEKVCLLVEEDEILSINDIRTICKYQTVDNIIAKAIKLVAETDQKNIDNIVYNNKNNCIVSVFSPVSRIGKSKFCINFGKYMSKKNYKVLVLDFEEYSLYENYLNESNLCDLSELMYYFKTNENKFILNLDAAITNSDADYIYGVNNPEDLRKVKYNLWIELINRLITIRNYDVVILDISALIDDYFKILMNSDIIAVPYIEDEYSSNKIKNFNSFINKSDYKEIINKILKVNIDKDMENICSDLYEKVLNTLGSD